MNRGTAAGIALSLLAASPAVDALDLDRELPVLRLAAVPGRGGLAPRLALGTLSLRVALAEPAPYVEPPPSPPAAEPPPAAAPAPEPPAPSAATAPPRAGAPPAPVVEPPRSPDLHVAAPIRPARGDVGLGRGAKAYGYAAAGVLGADALAALLLGLVVLAEGEGAGEAAITGALLALAGPPALAAHYTDLVLGRTRQGLPWAAFLANLAAGAAAVVVANERGLDVREGIALFVGIQLVVVPGTALVSSLLLPGPGAGAAGPAAAATPAG